MTLLLDIQPKLINWAIERARLDTAKEVDDKASGILKIAEPWISGEKKPTMNQLRDFAKRVSVPFGYLFLETPPEEPLPIADFRTFRDETLRSSSPDLLDTIYEMQSRQEWMRECLVAEEAEPVSFVGFLTETETIKKSASKIREKLGLDDAWVHGCKDAEERFSQLRRKADDAGILVFTSGIVGNNTRRTLDHEEFRGFVLADEFAPLVFVNRNDTLTAQLFTLAHELVHLALGTSGLFNLPNLTSGDKRQEKHCNAIAAELLVPSEDFLTAFKANNSFPSLARHFGVSTLVIARLALDHNLLSKDDFFAFYEEQQDNWKFEKERKKAGGDFYNTKKVRLSSRFSRAVIAAVRSGELLHQDAYRLTGLNAKTFEPFAKIIGEGGDE